ncbi:MAG: hypothetical protein R3E66_21005 [bacterium]
MKISVLTLISILFLASHAVAQMPEKGPAPGGANIDPKTMKRVEVLKQLKRGSQKDPEAQEESETTESGTANNVVAPPNIKMVRRPHRIGAGPDPSRRLASFAAASRRGREMRKHYIRMAKIERLDAIAAEKDDESLTQRVAAIRAKETARHARALETIERLKQEALSEPNDIKVKVDGELEQP